MVQNRQAKIEVVPSAAALIIKALKEPPRDRKKVKNSKKMEVNHLFYYFILVKHSGNITIDQVIEIAKTMRHRSMSRYLSGIRKDSDS